MKNIFLLIVSFALIACGSPKESKEVEKVQEEECTCEQLKKEIDSLKVEVNNLKKSPKRNTTTTTTSTTKKATTISKPKGKRDSDGSTRCSYYTKGRQCEIRTFSRNALCSKHGGD